MNEAEISQNITDTYNHVATAMASGDTFFFYNPDNTMPPDHRYMFATIVTSGEYDKYSDLNRPSVFRLNIGIGKQTFRAMFGKSSSEGSADTPENSPYDYTALDQVIPHPEYGRMYWVCVLNPSEETFESKVRPLLAEAYELVVGKYNKGVKPK